MNRFRVTYANGNQDEVVFEGLYESAAGSLNFHNGGITRWVVSARAWNFVEFLGPVEE